MIKITRMIMPLFILFFLISMSAFSKTHVLLIDGGTSPLSNWKGFYNNVRRGYEVARSSGFETKIIAKDGTWKIGKIQGHEKVKLSTIAYTKEGKESKDPNREKIPSYPPINRQARYANDIIEEIKTFKPKDNDTVLIYITGHGIAPSQYGDPSIAGVSGWYNGFTYDELAKTLSKLPKTIKIKIASNICHSGGVHHIARTLTNVCTSAITGYRSIGMSKIVEADFNIGFWGDLKEKGKDTSFAEMSIAGFREDDLNINMGNLSSFDYVDFVLNKGDYENFWPAPIAIGPFDFFGKYVKQHVLYSTSVFPPAEKIHIRDSTQTCKTGCDSDSILSNLEELDNLTEILKRIETKSLEQSLRDKANALPTQTQSVFHDVINDMKENGKKYVKIASDYDRQYKALQQEWNTYLKKKWNQRKEEDHSRSWRNEVKDTRAEFQAKVDALQKKAQGNSDLRRYAFNSQMLDRLGRLDKFSRVATAEQKQKFMQLLNCEWEPI